MACSNSSLCKAFKEMSERTWKALLACRNTGFQLGEESFTDFNLLRLVEKTKGVEITVRKFTKPQEAMTGADWEWWLVGPSGRCLGFRIQAKVLDLSTERYLHLHYRTNSTSAYQLDTLISKSLYTSPRTIPLVCLYSHLRKRKGVVCWPCNSSPPRSQYFGCSILPAIQARAFRTPHPRNRAADILPLAFPMHCLFCCCNYGGRELPDRALSFWKAKIAPEELRSASSDAVERDRDMRELSAILRDSPEFIQSSLPDYVARLSARRWPGQSSSDDTSESGLAGVVILRELPSAEAREEGRE